MKPDELAGRNITGARGGRTYRLTLTAMLTVVALMFSYIEAMIPVTFGIPGFKLGFANIMVIISLYALDARYAFMTDILRIMLSGLLFGTPFSMLYSLAGGMLSFVVMWLLRKTGAFSVIGVSMAGGVFHNLGQLTVAALAVSSISMYIYFPVLVFTGIATGIGTGVIAYVVLKRLPRHEA